MFTKTELITALAITALIAGSCGAHIPSGMYRSVETSLPPVSLHSVRNATNNV